MSQFCVSDPESSFEVIDDSADCSMELVEEPSEDTVKREEAVILTSTNSPISSKSHEAPTSKSSGDFAELDHQVVKSSEPSNTDKRLWKLARKFQKLSRRVENIEAARNERPILEEISGTWMLISGEICGKEVAVPDDDFLKFKVIDNCIEVYTMRRYTTEARTALITSEHLTPTIKIMLDYIDDNQWYTLIGKSWTVRQIQNGQLVIEYHCGEMYRKEVFERIERTAVSSCEMVLTTIALYLFARWIASPFVDFFVITYLALSINSLVEDSSH